MTDFAHVADYGSYPLEIVSGEGCYLTDANGKRYIDFIGGWCVATVGWKHPRMQDALREAAQLALYVSPIFRWRAWEEFATLLTDIVPGNLRRAFRCTSGSEAVEFAIKIARAATGKAGIVSVDHVYHGHTYGAASIGTGLRDGMGPGIPETYKIPLPDTYDNEWNLSGVELSDKIVAQFEEYAGRGDIAGFISEPIFTNAGAIIPPADFFPKIAEACKRHDVLFIMDEVASGFGRTGKLFASELWGLTPDIVCLGKGISGGYATLGATLTTEKLFHEASGISAFSTFGWMPTDLIVARANVELILKEKLWENARRVGTRILELLKPLEKLPHVGIVRGKGMLFGIHIVKNKNSKAGDRARTERIVKHCIENGLLIDTSSPDTLFFTPPLIMDEQTADVGVKILREAVENV